MTETLLEGLGLVGNALSAPGDYLRGAIGGRFGERMGSKELFGISEDAGFGGDLLGFAGDVATDPLTFAGGLLGGLLGKGASKAAALRGPRYGTTIDDATRMPFKKGGDLPEGVNDKLFQWANVPGAEKAFSEVHPGSQILGAGAEAVTFESPGGRVVRIGQDLMKHPGRPVSDNVLQTSRTVDYPVSGRTAMRTEHMPLANPANVERPPQTLLDNLADEGLEFGDWNLGNWGTQAGRYRPLVIDPGSVDALDDFAGAFQPVLQSAEGSPLMRALLAAVGGDRATQRAVEAGLSGPNFVPSFAGIGAGAGASAGAFGRQQRGAG